MYLRRMNRVKGEISFYEPLNTDWDGNELLLSLIYLGLVIAMSLNLLKRKLIGDFLL